MKFDVNYLLREKLLARIPASKEKAEESMKASYSWLDSKERLKERKLCSKLKEGICEVKKKIYVGQEIRIKILDDAGNSWVDSFVA